MVVIFRKIQCLLLGVFAFLGVSLFAQAAEPAGLVIYVHGWNPDAGNADVESSRVLEALFPEHRIEHFKWNASGDFPECLERCEAVTMRLCRRIEELPAKERERTILIGHSLGGRIVIKAMAHLQPQKLAVKRGIFLAAAIPNDSPEIAKAITNSREPNVNVYDATDYVLRHLYSLGEDMKNALGAFGYAFAHSRRQMVQLKVDSDKGKGSTPLEFVEGFDRHDAAKYLNFLLRKKEQLAAMEKNAKGVDASTAVVTIEKIHVMQDLENVPVKIVHVGVLWSIIDEMDGWRLQKREFGGELYRIIDPLDYQRAVGSAEKMRQSFEAIKQQIAPKK